MLCRICNASSQLAFSHEVLGKYDVSYFFCANCGGVQTEDPYWLDEAYERPVALADTGILVRNIELARLTSLVLLFLFDHRGRFLDAAGGYGIFTRMMRDIGFDFYWNDKYSPNLAARGFEVAQSGGLPFAAVTAFEVMEHLSDPVSFVADLLATTKVDTIIFSTELFEGQPPAPDYWWYYSFATGQHITFYQKRTLEHIGQQFGMHYHTSGMLHIWTRKHINKLALRVITSRRISPILTRLPQHVLGSRTWADHEKLIAMGVH